MDEQDDEEDFNDLLNDVQYRHNDDDSDYILDESDDDKDSIRSWETDCTATEEEEGMVITNY